LIAWIFPGLFHYEELLELDWRDFQFWLKEAKKKRLRDRHDRILTTGIGMVGGDAFTQETTLIEWSLKLLEQEENQT
jgi:hypothetical protein